MALRTKIDFTQSAHIKSLSTTLHTQKPGQNMGNPSAGGYVAHIGKKSCEFSMIQ